MRATGPSESLVPTTNDVSPKKTVIFSLLSSFRVKGRDSHSYKITGNIHFHRILTMVYRSQNQSVFGHRRQSYTYCKQTSQAYVYTIMFTAWKPQYMPVYTPPVFGYSAVNVDTEFANICSESRVRPLPNRNLKGTDSRKQTDNCAVPLFCSATAVTLPCFSCSDMGPVFLSTPQGHALHRT